MSLAARPAAPFRTQNRPEMRVVCHHPDCGYLSRNTYNFGATAEMTNAYNLATKHAREAHKSHNNAEKVPDPTAPSGFRITRLVTVEPATPATDGNPITPTAPVGSPAEPHKRYEPSSGNHEFCQNRMRGATPCWRCEPCSDYLEEQRRIGQENKRRLEQQRITQKVREGSIRTEDLPWHVEKRTVEGRDWWMLYAGEGDDLHLCSADAPTGIQAVADDHNAKLGLLAALRRAKDALEGHSLGAEEGAALHVVNAAIAQAEGTKAA